MNEWVARHLLGELSWLKMLRRRSDLPPSPGRILVVKLYGVGDTVLLLPGLKLLRATYPRAHLVFLASPATSIVLQEMPFLDALLIFDSRGLRGLGRTVAQLRAGAFDVAIDMEQSALTSALLTWLSGAKARIGFVPQRDHGRGVFYSREVLFNDRQHVSRTFLDLLEPLGVQGEVRELEPLRLRPEETGKVEEFLAGLDLPATRGLVGIQIGGNPKRLEERLWPLGNFAELADAIIERYGSMVIFTGSAQEAGLIQRARALMKGQAISVAGRFSLREFAHLAGKLDVFISSDTGPMHVAAAMRTKVIGLFGPDLPTRYAPVGEGHVALYRRVPCSPCNNAHLRQLGGCPERTCLKLITVPDVLEVLENVLAQPVRRS